MSRVATNLHSLRGRLAAFFALLIAAILALFSGAVYLTAVAIEAEETEPQADKDRELGRVRQLLAGSLGLGIPLGAGLAGLGSVWMTRRTLRSIAAIVRAASELDPEHLDQRIPASPSDDAELKPLIAALNQMLARLDRAVSGLRRFTQDAAHELRTPIAALMSRLEIALRRPRDVAALRATIEESLEELSTLSRLVDALLLLARSDAGELPIERQPVCLPDLFDELASLYEGVLEQRHLRLHLRCPAALSLHTDKLLLGRALANLLDNACKFSPDGATIVLIATQHPTHIAIGVHDDGPGIPSDEVGRVCDRFFRGAAQRGDSPGFGLGLALTHEFVAALAGSIRIQSGPVTGTVVELRLPHS